MKAVLIAILICIAQVSFAKSDIYVFPNGDTLTESDSIKFLPGRPMEGVVIDYIRKDNFYSMHMAYIDRMPGKTYAINKIRGGVAYITVKDVRMNDWSFLKYKLYLTRLSNSKSIERVKR